MSVTVCVELVQGTLGIPLNIYIHITSPNGQGMFVHVQRYRCYLVDHIRIICNLTHLWHKYVCIVKIPVIEYTYMYIPVIEYTYV